MGGSIPMRKTSKNYASRDVDDSPNQLLTSPRSIRSNKSLLHGARGQCASQVAGSRRRELTKGNGNKAAKREPNQT
ncbi:hypothetical protein CCACVL1_21631 [Corchorus capsularis]|uniref:Uncharacterized protein n=1 Tax=Corchorus capsularis TaxID=210143 RepID=A0A1R3H2P7_COCAP|nr:hypothetical protein CCACVL1_21631 [Corchorus capsularis]